MDGIGECGCSGMVGNHLQVAIHPYFGFAIIPDFYAQVPANIAQCNYPLYTQRDIVFDESRVWGANNLFRLTTIRQVMNVFTGKVTETLLSQTGNVFPGEPTMPAGIPWSDFTRYDQGVTATTQQTIIVKGSGGSIDWGYLIHIYVTLSVPNSLAAWSTRCDALKWFPSIANIRSKLAESGGSDYSLTLWTYNEDSTKSAFDVYGYGHCWDSGNFDPHNSLLRFVRTGANYDPYLPWLGLDSEGYPSDFPGWLWNGYLPEWSISRGYIYNRSCMNAPANGLIYGEEKYQPYAFPTGITFQASVRLFTLPDTTLPIGSPNPDTRYAFAQSLLSGVCEGTITNTGNYFDVSQDTEMVLDMNETASSNPDTGRNLRGSQSVTTVLG